MIDELEGVLDAARVRDITVGSILASQARQRCRGEDDIANLSSRFSAGPY
jgi:hypothetical protein